jgi:hypothetical protein
LTLPEQLESTGLTVAETNTVLDALAAAVEPISFHFRWRPQLKDLGDEKKK